MVPNHGANEGADLRGFRMASSPLRLLVLWVLVGAVACDRAAPVSASLVATQTQPMEVVPGQGFEVEVRLSNESSVPAKDVRVGEVFQGTQMPSAESVVGSLAAGEERAVTFRLAAPGVAARGEGESAATYQQRLETVESQRLLSQGQVHFTDSQGAQGAPLSLSSSSQLVLPRLTLGLEGPSQVLPDQEVAYTLTASNVGTAAAVSGRVKVVLPDSTQVEVPLNALAPGATWREEVTWTAPPLPARQEGERASEYAARLRALDGQAQKAQVSLSWQDNQGNTYGSLSEETAAALQVEVPPSNLPPNPEEVAPPLPTLSVPTFEDSVSFLYSGDNPIQVGVAPGTLEPRRLTVLRGKVLSRQGYPLEGVRVSLLDHPEYGHTLTREDGLFDLAVNGGGPLTVRYEAEGLLPSQRQLQVPWGDFAWLPDVVLVPLDPQGTPVDFTGASTNLQVARGSPVTDEDGTRQATLLFAPGTQALAVLPNGDEVPLYSATVRATEYTVGAAGPASMPAHLPPTSGYTYAVELSLDEALALDSQEVRFTQPVASYVDNFLGFPVGGPVPAGYYDRRRGVWLPSDNGRILQVHSVIDGVAQLDVTGDGLPDSVADLSALGITEAEQRQLASLYPVGKSLWRVPVTHFTPWDYNWPYGPPPGARSPTNAAPRKGPENKPECQSGSVIDCQNQALGESLPLLGTPFRLHYRSDRMQGPDNKTLRIPVSGASVPPSVEAFVVEVSVAGRLFTHALPAAPHQTLSFTWDGKDAYGRIVQGGVPVTGRTGYLYPLVYLKPAEFTQAFALAGSEPIFNRQQREMTLWQTWESQVGGWSETPENLGGWRLSPHHQWDGRGKMLFLGNGERRLEQATGGSISTAAGTATWSFGGDGGPATQAHLGKPSGVAVGPDGSLYIADRANSRIRRVGPDGTISTVAGTGTEGFGGDGGPATQALVYYPRGVAVGPDGSLYIADTTNNRIRRVGPDGTISTVAGTGTEGFGGDGGPATQALLKPMGVALGPDGSLYIADSHNYRIRRVDPKGTISTVVGTGTPCFCGDGGPPTQALLGIPADVALGPDGSLYIADEWTHRIRRVGFSPFTSVDEVSVTSEDGSEVYVFGLGGRHLRTVDALTRALRYRFEYNTDGLLTSVTDGDGLVTRVERDTSGKPLAIVAPHGQRTLLSFNAQGYLASLTNPAGETVDLTHASNGLLSSLRDARGGLHQYTYDAQGKLERDTHPGGGYKQLTRTNAEDGYTVAVSTALGSTTHYQVQELPGGGQRRYTTAPDGTVTSRLLALDGSTTTITTPDGTVTTEVLGPDARFGMQAPLFSSLQVKLPSGLTSTFSHGNVATYANGDRFQELSTLVDTRTRNGRTYTSTYTAASRTLRARSPEGRQSTAIYDEKGRLVRQEVPGVLPVEYSYDSEGRLWTVTQGERAVTYAYNAAGYLETVVDPLQRTTGFSYDPAGRLTSQQLPGGFTVGFSFDAHGNLIQLVPPERPAHAFLYTPADTTARYTPPPPSVSTPLPPTEYVYDLDGALSSATSPDGSTIRVTRDNAGRVDFLTTARTTVDFGYDAQGRLSSLTDSTGPSLAYAYDGSLVRSVAWSGAVQGSVGYTYTPDFTLGTLNVQGQSFAYGYDNDGVLTSAGVLSLGRRADNGLLSSTTLGQVNTEQQYTPYGELRTLSAAFGTTSIYNLTLDRDAAGRISSKTEVVAGVPHSWGYTYDEAGRLHTATLDGVLHATYGYDAQGNRTSLTRGGTTLGATYDAQDRLQTHGAASYTFGPNGELQQRLRTPEASPTRYVYDALGALIHVQLPDGTQVDYVVDAANRRVGKRLGGSLVQGFLYDGALRVVAELDGAGAVASRFVYASQGHVPDYMVKGGVTYRLLTDHLGSIRLVVDASTGVVAQAIEYGPFGEVLADSNPGFQPFGFAGGLYDQDTRLLRFGARDYDAEVGRWTSKDPIRFRGGDTNLYAYVGGNPVEYIDPSGLKPVTSDKCASLERLLEFDDQQSSARGVLFSSAYNSLNGSELPGLNATFETIGGPVDADWMLRTAGFGSGLVPGLSNAAYYVVKPAWNLVNGASPTAGISEPGHANAPAAAQYWLTSGKSLREIFGPALKQCECMK